MIDEQTSGTTDEPLRPGTHYRTVLFSQLDIIEKHGLVVDIGGRDGRFLGVLGVQNGVVVDTEVAAREPSVSYVGGSGLDVPLADATADTVIAFDVIEHVPDERRFVAELLRVVKPGGQVVITTPSDDIRVLPGRFQNFIDRSWGHHRVRGYSVESLETLFAEAGAGEVSVVSVGMRVYRRLYVPLRLVWSLPGPMGRALVRLAASRDAVRLEGERGFRLVVARR